MNEYHKIQTVYNRDPKTNYKTLLVGEWALPEFEYLAYNNWVFTEKVDGTNIRVIWDGNRVSFQGKTDRAVIPTFLHDSLKSLFADIPFGDIFDCPACLYGEGYGAKIQKGGGNYRPDQSFVLFDIKIGQWWLKRSDVEDVANKMKIDIVPIIGKGTLFQMEKTVKDGFKSHWGDFMAEGIVARPEIDLYARNGARIITKLKYNDFTKGD